MDSHWVNKTIDPRTTIQNSLTTIIAWITVYVYYIFGVFARDMA